MQISIYWSYATEKRGPLRENTLKDTLEEGRGPFRENTLKDTLEYMEVLLDKKSPNSRRGVTSFKKKPGVTCLRRLMFNSYYSK